MLGVAQRVGARGGIEIQELVPMTPSMQGLPCTCVLFGTQSADLPVNFGVSSGTLLFLE